MTRLQRLATSEWERAARPLKEAIIRRKHGDHTHTETVQAVVQLDSAAAGSPVSAGGLQQTQDRNQAERGGTIEVAASQEILGSDTLEIYGELWSVTGLAVGQDAGSKTFVIRQVKRFTGRQPNVNTRA